MFHQIQRVGLLTQPKTKASIGSPGAPAVYHPNAATVSQPNPRTSMAPTGAPPVYRPAIVRIQQPLGSLLQAKPNQQAVSFPKPLAAAPPVYNPNNTASNSTLQRFTSQKVAQARLAPGVIQMRRIRDLIADLTGAGFVLVSTRGSHRRYQNGATNVNLSYHNAADNAHNYQETAVANAIAAVAPAPAAPAAAPAPVAYIGLAAMGIA